MTRKPARVILLKDARQKLNPPPPPRWKPFAALYRIRHALVSICLVSLAVIHFEKLPYSYLIVPIGNKLIDYGVTGAISPRTEAIDGRFVTCSGPHRVNCVVDGDTFWYRSVKYRISDINAPEIGRPSCEAERRLGQEAQVALLQTLNGSGLTMERRERRDVDQYGRKLRVVLQDGRSIGDALIARGLAHRWEGHKLSWCG
ncbi:thermonuclease family protein [Rhizobium sp. AQ_MP]|uniref:thermonuclease family protein n=1 Tax=Rhizobium sp. AQ_MP TaxID=2761536 RepID=UPI001639D339|nr:thermonuclease family protein [Rhizobium sp. AQ_MP]MBC2773971.1 thermonuclease family protein [Rhizobium sp. AQ_MP]